MQNLFPAGSTLPLNQRLKHRTKKWKHIQLDEARAVSAKRALSTVGEAYVKLTTFIAGIDVRHFARVKTTRDLNPRRIIWSVCYRCSSDEAVRHEVRATGEGASFTAVSHAIGFRVSDRF